MDEQHRDFMEMQKERLPTADTAVVAVASGDGLHDVFVSLGAAAIVPGGQTMNPSTKDILQAVESTFSDKVIILPNNKNIVLTANQVHSLTQKNVVVVPSTTIPQGVVALLAFDYEADFNTNAKIMEKALSSVRSIEITKSVRSTKVNGLKIRRKQPIGLLDGDLVAVGDSDLEVINKLLTRLNLEEAEVVTIYYGEDVEETEPEQIGNSIREQYPQLQVEVIRGGQPHYSYIISVE
jgi:dihydroxyacetone kinase-like predicted kinase